jgi:hypothetical protein
MLPKIVFLGKNTPLGLSPYILGVAGRLEKRLQSTLLLLIEADDALSQ